MQIDARLKDAGALTELDFNATVGDLKASVKGTLKELSLVGADLTLTVEKPEVGPLFEALKLPVIATGPMRIDTHIKDVGKHRQLDLKAKVGDLEASVNGTLKTRAWSDPTSSSKPRPRTRRVLPVCSRSAVCLRRRSPSRATRCSHARRSSLSALTAAIAGASVRADGSMRLTRDRKTALRFKLAAASLAKLRETWPEMKVSASGAFESAKGRIEVKDLKAALGENQLAGSLLLTDGAKHIEAQLSSPRLDLTPFFPQDKKAETAAAGRRRRHLRRRKSKSRSQKKKFMFSETPLHLDKMKDTDAKVHLACGELVLGDRSIKDLDSNLRVDHGQADVRHARSRRA